MGKFTELRLPVQNPAQDGWTVTLEMDSQMVEWTTRKHASGTWRQKHYKNSDLRIAG